MRIRIYLKCNYPPFQITSIDTEATGDITKDEALAFLESQFMLSDFSYVNHESLKNWGILK